MQLSTNKCESSYPHNKGHQMPAKQSKLAELHELLAAQVVDELNW
ncbi:putative terminase small subunit [Pseudomonas phage phiGM22-3]|uniref:Putative terminase small subunit n=1 Tax=Pseudomonas phage phiGM22-3 TaxID=2816462 RepID=A0A8T8IVN7_9CAUD|nr:putative terminase small subunit [Pseudomonas phage phiGM22-3]